MKDGTKLCSDFNKAGCRKEVLHWLIEGKWPLPFLQEGDKPQLLTIDMSTWMQWRRVACAGTSPSLDVTT